MILRGYSSSGDFSSLFDILSSEKINGDATVCSAISRYIHVYPNAETKKAIWLTLNPIACAKAYLLGAECGSISDQEFTNTYPDWERYVIPIEIRNLHLVCIDPNKGYLFVDDI